MMRYSHDRKFIGIEYLENLLVTLSSLSILELISVRSCLHHHKYLYFCPFYYINCVKFHLLLNYVPIITFSGCLL